MTPYRHRFVFWVKLLSVLSFVLVQLVDSISIFCHALARLFEVGVNGLQCVGCVTYSGISFLLLDAIQVTRGFCSKNRADSRSYSYTMPTFAFTPHDQVRSAYSTLMRRYKVFRCIIYNGMQNVFTAVNRIHLYFVCNVAFRYFFVLSAIERRFSPLRFVTSPNSVALPF